MTYSFCRCRKWRLNHVKWDSGVLWTIPEVHRWAEKTMGIYLQQIERTHTWLPFLLFKYNFRYILSPELFILVLIILAGYMDVGWSQQTYKKIILAARKQTKQMLICSFSKLLQTHSVHQILYYKSGFIPQMKLWRGYLIFASPKLADLCSLSVQLFGSIYFLPCIWWVSAPYT